MDDRARNRFKSASLLLFFLCYCFIPQPQSYVKAETVGYGYRIRSVAVESSSLTADLGLIKKSAIYGPDIQSLQLFARYVSIYLHVYNELCNRLRGTPLLVCGLPPYFSLPHWPY